MHHVNRESVTFPAERPAAVPIRFGRLPKHLEPIRFASEPQLPEVTVNGVRLSDDEIRLEARNHPAATLDEALQQAARALVIRQVLLDEATRQRVTLPGSPPLSSQTEAPEDVQIRMLLERSIETPVADRTEIEHYYQQNRKRFRRSPLFEVRHILLSAAAENSDHRARQRHAAEQLLSELEQNPSLFSLLAAEWSDCPTAHSGGRLGSLVRGSTVPEFERAIIALAESTPGPALIESRFGVHVVVIDRFVPGDQLPLSAVEARIAAWLEAASWSRAVAQYIELLLNSAKITGIEFARAEHGSRG